LLCHVALQVLLSSTTQIEKAFPYTFLWSWLGYGLLTSTGTVLEKHSPTICKVMKCHSTTVSEVMELIPAAVSEGIKHLSAAVIKEMEKYPATVC